MSQTTPIPSNDAGKIKPAVPADTPQKRKVPEDEAFCMKCKNFQKFKVSEDVGANNKSSIIKKGICEKCNGKVSRIVSKPKTTSH